MKSEVYEISKNTESMPTGEVLKIFRNAETLEEIKEAVLKAEERLFVGWASVDAIDNDQEKIPIEEIVQVHETALARGGGLNDMHTNKNVGRMLAYRVMTHPKTNTSGVLQLNKVYNNYELDDQVWREIQNGDRTGLSVGGYSMKNEFVTTADGEMYNKLSDYRQYETSTVYKPANPYATNEAVSAIAKSSKDVDGMFFVKNNTVYKIVKEGRCWEGYAPVEGKKPYSEDSCKPKAEYEEVDKAEFEGKEVELNQPMRNPEGDSAYMVYTTHPETGNPIRVKFGDADMENNRDNSEARSNFRARHQCENKTFEKDRHTKGYWICKFWSSTPVSELLKKTSKSDSNILKENVSNKEQVQLTMAEENQGKDILEVAMQKMDSDETLSQEEKSAIKAMYSKKTEKADSETEEGRQPQEEGDIEEEHNKADGEDIGKPAKDQPKVDDAEDANDMAVAKMSKDIAKSLKAQILKEMSEIVKSAPSTAVASTPAPVGKQDVSKGKTHEEVFNPADLAMGKTSMKWHDVAKKLGE